MRIKLDQIKLANPIKVNRNEDLVFRDEGGRLRDHGAYIDLVAVKIPVENAPGEFVTQPLVKITDKQSRVVTYTSLMNTIYFKGDIASEPMTQAKPKRTKKPVEPMRMPSKSEVEKAFEI